MFKVSKSASAELKSSMKHHDFDDMPVRIAAQRADDGSIEYQMGFDEPGPGDTMIAAGGGIDIVIAKDHLPLLNGAELDFVLMDDEQHHFIFMNPNDKNFVAPTETEATSATRSDEKN